MVDAAVIHTVQNHFRSRRMTAFAVPALILLYLGHAFLAFDIPALAARALWENAAVLLWDLWSNKNLCDAGQPHRRCHHHDRGRGALCLPSARGR